MVRHGANQVYGLGTPMHFMSKTGTHDLCYMCHGRGVKECHHCKGGGKKPCTACCGTGSVRNFTKLKIYLFPLRSYYLVLNLTIEFDSEYDRRKLVHKIVTGDQFSPIKFNILDIQSPVPHIQRPYKARVLPITKYPVEEVNEKSKQFCAQHLQNSMGMCRVIRVR
ncbi:unnamed protein product [Cylicostephanus goldi]|uniref:Protein SSUH2 homolog n=1 Tax=Cylicostephanus goldi TaxID=71465 RepID=A0A3P7MUV6_CYLGO|nr:unnamed protein product [Cylicostephanus goldi]